jgi:hypothetical protein
MSWPIFHHLFTDSEVTTGPGHHGRRRARTSQHAWPAARLLTRRRRAGAATLERMRPMLEQASARNSRRVTHVISSLSGSRGFPGAAPGRDLSARHDRACRRSPRTARVVFPRVKGTRLLGAGDVQQKKEKRGQLCGGGATFARSFVGVGCCSSDQSLLMQN